MIIGTKRLLELVRDSNLVERLCLRELANPEGEGLELRAGEIYKFKEGERGFLRIKDRATPAVELECSYVENSPSQKVSIILPWEYRLVKTVESVNLPSEISCRFEPRTTLQRSGILFRASNASPGYSGELTFGLYNAGGCIFELEMGARICTAIFYETGENISNYRGQWKSGRVSTQGKSEGQV